MKLSENFAWSPHFSRSKFNGLFSAAKLSDEKLFFRVCTTSMIKMGMKTGILGLDYYSFRAKIPKISQLKFGLYSKTGHIGTPSFIPPCVKAKVGLHTGKKIYPVEFCSLPLLGSTT